jgi:hypothetical protein
MFSSEGKRGVTLCAERRGLLYADISLIKLKSSR